MLAVAATTSPGLLTCFSPPKCTVGEELLLSQETELRERKRRPCDLRQTRAPGLTRGVQTLGPSVLQRAWDRACSREQSDTLLDLGRGPRPHAHPWRSLLLKGASPSVRGKRLHLQASLYSRGRTPFLSSTQGRGRASRGWPCRPLWTRLGVKSHGPDVGPVTFLHCVQPPSSWSLVTGNPQFNMFADNTGPVWAEAAARHQGTRSAGQNQAEVTALGTAALLAEQGLWQG